MESYNIFHISVMNGNMIQQNSFHELEIGFLAKMNSLDYFIIINSCEATFNKIIDSPVQCRTKQLLDMIELY